MRQVGVLEVRGAFADNAQGPWADEARPDVDETLMRELEARQAAGDHTVTDALATGRHL